MSTPRRPLGEISSNILRRRELSPNTRGEITRAAKFGHSSPTIARMLNVYKSIVRSTIKRALLRNRSKTRPRKGRPRDTTDRDERYLLRYIRLNPIAKNKEVIKALGAKYSVRTIKRILKRNGITNWRAKKRPHLTPLLASKRLAWCKERSDWDVVT